MIEGQFAVAFAAGLLAVANPCGFAMLPPYLSFFLGVEGQEPGTRAGLSRALAVGLSVSAGFALTFFVVDQAIRSVAGDLLSWSPWVSIVIGFVMVGFGAAQLAGRALKVNLPRLDRGGRSGSIRSMVLYGASYGIVSLGCSLPTFSAYMGATSRRSGFVNGLGMFLAYAAGFTLLLTGLSVGAALARQGLAQGVRRTFPYLQRISGGMLVLAGLYVAYYGWYLLRRIGEQDPIVDRVTGWSSDIALWITDIGTETLGLLLALVVAAAALLVATSRRRAA